jgi:hypothetical protein
VARATISRRTAAALAGCAILCGCGREPELSSLDQPAIESLKSYNPVYQLNRDGRVIQLALEGKQVGAAALEQVRHLTELRCLSLYGASVTDDSLANLKGLRRLEQLGLAATPITDKALSHLEKMACLCEIWLPKKGKLTAGRVARLQQALPGLDVHWQE